MKRLMLWSVLASTLTLAGCAGSGYGYGSAYARTAPPPLRSDRYGAAPGPGYIWLNGNWAYRGNNYVWNSGRWQRPPRGRTRWEDGRWENRGNRYVWRDGRWR